MPDFPGVQPNGCLLGYISCFIKHILNIPRISKHNTLADFEWVSKITVQGAKNSFSPHRKGGIKPCTGDLLENGQDK